MINEDAGDFFGEARFHMLGQSFELGESPLPLHKFSVVS